MVSIQVMLEYRLHTRHYERRSISCGVLRLNLDCLALDHWIGELELRRL
jgi:hypothetical protein